MQLVREGAKEQSWAGIRGRGEGKWSKTTVKLGKKEINSKRFPGMGINYSAADIKFTVLLVTAREGKIAVATCLPFQPVLPPPILSFDL